MREGGGWWKSTSRKIERSMRLTVPVAKTTALVPKPWMKGREDWLGADVRFCLVLALCCSCRLSNYDNGEHPWLSQKYCHKNQVNLIQLKASLSFSGGFNNWINILISNYLSPISSLRLLCYENMQRRLTFQQLSGFFYKQRFPTSEEEKILFLFRLCKLGDKKILKQ